MIKKYALLISLVLVFNKETITDPKTLTNYLAKIGNTPTQLGLENISTTNIEYGGSLSLKNNKIYFTKASDDFSRRIIVVSSFKDGHFTHPKKVRFGKETFNNASDVQISPDGESLYFKMLGNITNNSLRRDGNIWKSTLKNGTWSKAEMLPKEINSKLNEYYPIATNSGNIYFSRNNKTTSYDIYVSRFVDGKYTEAEKLPEYINTNLLESDAYVSPDESFMIFVRMYAKDGLGVSDLYISFNDKGIWSQPKNMRSLNSKGVDGSPFVTSDGKHLIFTSTRDSENPKNFDGHLDIYVVKFNKEDWR